MPYQEAMFEQGLSMLAKLCLKREAYFRDYSFCNYWRGAKQVDDFYSILVYFHHICTIVGEMVSGSGC